MATATYYVAFCAVCITVLKELNVIVNEPYMVCSTQRSVSLWTDFLVSWKDEPFHVPQAQAYCRGDFTAWDPKITTPPGL